MITELHVRGFKSLVDVKIPFGPGITVMVGANNSGKTNVLSALKLLRECARTSNSKAIEALGGFASLKSRGASSISIDASIRLNDSAFSRGYHWGQEPGEGIAAAFGANQLPLPSYFEQSSAADKTFRGIRIFDLAVASIRAEAALEPNARMESDGLNLAAVIDILANTKPDLLERISSEVQRAAPEVKRVLTPPGSRPGTKVIGIQEQSGHVFRADEISDGLLLLIALSTASQRVGAGPGRFLAIEEPERGIHPRRLRELLDQFRRLANRGTQILLTTHSPLVLDEFRDTPESVLILDRDEQGTHVQRLSDHPEWQAQVGLGAPLGDLWYSGLLGGVPR